MIVEQRVESLCYEITSDPHTEYAVSEEIKFETVLGKFLMSNRQLTFWPTECFSSVEEARAAVEPFLRAWEAHTELKLGAGTIIFRFSGGVCKDLSSSKEGTMILTGLSVSSMAMAAIALPTVTRKTYPPRPENFCVTDDVSMAARRWRNYQSGREALLPVAYLIFTILVNPERKRNQASAIFNVDVAVLSKLSELSSTINDEVNARKVMGVERNRNLSDSERAWLEAAIPMLILRLGHLAGGAPLERITLAALPQILP